MTQALDPERAQEITRKLALAKLVDMLRRGTVGWLTGRYHRDAKFCAVGMLGLLYLEEHDNARVDFDPRSGCPFDVSGLQSWLGDDFDLMELELINDGSDNRYQVADEIERRYLR